jgi:hypothetical protein
MKQLYTISMISIFSIEAIANEQGNMTQVESIYVGTDSTARPYVTMKESNSMPGCHGNRGGYLYGDDIDKAYSTVLAALKSGSDIRAYYQLNPNNEGWSKCYIKAISAY